MFNASSKFTGRTLAFVTSSLCTLAFGLGTANASPSHDAWLTTKTKLALLTSSRIPSNAVHVDTSDGRIVLHGTVTTSSESMCR